MDRHFSKAINDMFTALYHQGLVYRGQRVVMWDMQLKTALSNIEINAVVHDKKLYFIRYYDVHDRQQSLVVATSRPETMFADQALVVHPQDDRYQSLIGQRFINPVNQERLPLIASKLVISQFGTGVLKCTPGHDQKD